MVQVHFLRHHPQHEVNIEVLAQQQCQLVLTEGGQDALGEFVSRDGVDAERWILGTPAPNTGASKLPLSPVGAGVAPALALKLKVAAILETRVKCNGS